MPELTVICASAPKWILDLYDLFFDPKYSMFNYHLLRRPLITGLLISLCAALLGVNLVLKHYSMIGDGLSHVGFGALAFATALNTVLARLITNFTVIPEYYISIPIVILAAFLLLRISESGKIKGDAAVALISTSALAVGFMILSITSGVGVDVCNSLFGRAMYGMAAGEVIFSSALCGIILILYVLFYNRIFAVTFDESFSKATGTRAGLYNMLIAMLTAVTIVIGMRIMGALLISGLIIFPALTSMRVCKRFRSVVICSAILSVSCFFIGFVVSYLFGTATGASIVFVNLIAFLIFTLIGILKNHIGAIKAHGRKKQ